MLKVKDVSITHPDGTLEILDPDVLERGWTANAQNAADHYFDQWQLQMNRGMTFQEDMKEHHKIVGECLDIYNLSYDEARSFQIAVTRFWNRVLENLIRREKRRSRQSPLS